MGATRARFGFAILFCSLLIAISIKGWFSYNQLTDRIYASIRQQLSFALDAGQVQYDPVNQIISLKKIVISAPGFDVEAASLQLEIVAPGWRDIGRQTFPVIVEHADFANASLQIDAPEALLPLLDLGDTTFHEGVIYPGKNSPGFSFSSLDFQRQPDSTVGISAAGANGLSWGFEGVMGGGSESISGKLIFKQQDIAHFFSDSGYSGDFDAALNLEWFASKPLRLYGELRGETGHYQYDEFSFFWDGWRLSDVEFSDWQMVNAENALVLDNGRLELSNASVLPFLNWFEAHSLPFAGMEMAYFQVKSVLDQGEDFNFADARLSLNDEKGRYHLTSKLVSGGQLSLTGNPAGEYRIALENVVPASLGILEATRYHHFSNRRYSFSYNSQSGIGRLSFWRQNKSENYSLLERLLFNADGFAELTFMDKAVGLLDIKITTGKQISAQLKSIQSMPFAYLSHLIDKPLQPYFEHVPGEPDLNLGGEDNLAALKKICELRPGLSWQLEASFSESEDWPQIARRELEQTLADLSPDESARLEKEAREKLVEQLYLVTQKQKMPDVGLVAKEERIEQAEQWLIDSWPKNPGLVGKLLEDRKKELAIRFEKYGLPEVTILSDEQRRDLPRSWLSIK